MQTKLISTLQKANQEIKCTVSRLSDSNVASIYQVLPPGELQALNGKLAGIAAHLAQLSREKPKEAALESALGEYLSNLESLKTVLTGVQNTLARQRDQVKKDLAHMHSTRAWLDVFRATSSA